MSTIECGICFLQYNEEELIPRVLINCGHTICQQCAIRLSKDERTITCPFDREVTKLIRNGGVNGLPKNFALLELSRKANQEQEKNSEKEDDAPCFENPSHKAVFYCQQCEVELCDSCFTSVHKPKSLTAHQKINISEKPIKLPKCSKHPHNVAEFLCADPYCKISAKIMCQTCVLFDQHKSHKHVFLMEKLLENKERLNNLLIRNEILLCEKERSIHVNKKQLKCCEVTDDYFKNAVQSISDQFDVRKIEAIRKLTEFANVKKNEQTALKTRLEKEYSESMNLKELIGKKLKKKTDLENTEEITCLEKSHKSRISSQDEPDGFLDFEFIVPEMELQIEPKPKIYRHRRIGSEFSRIEVYPSEISVGMILELALSARHKYGPFLKEWSVPQKLVL
ncbi:unnamed protein product [Caenorhabditis brenneri]